MSGEGAGGKGMAWHVRARQDKARQARRARQGKAKQGKAWRGGKAAQVEMRD
jgi:hypothetical protein